MQVLKALVIIMGVLLAAGTVALVFAIIHHRAATRDQTAQASLAMPGHASLNLPAGSRVAQMIGIGDRVELLMVAPDGKQSLLLVEPATGKTIETIGIEAP